MSRYYIHNGQAQEGPFSIEELAAKNIKPDTPVWYEGLQEWTTAKDVEELKSIFQSTPPVFVKNNSSPSQNAAPVYQSAAPEPVKKEGSIIRKLFWLSAFIVLVLTSVFIFNKISRDVEVDTEEGKKKLVRDNITFYVTTSTNEYTYNSLGGIYNLEVSVTNRSEYLIDNVKVKVTYIKANGGVWAARTYDFNMIDRQTTSTLKIPDTDRGTSVQCEIVSITSRALGLY